MENRSFESESGGSHQNPKDNPPGPSQTRAGPSSSGQDQDERTPPLAKITDDEDESPPAHVQRYMQNEGKRENLMDLDLDFPAPEPVPEDRDLRQDPVFQRQASERQKRRSRQLSVDGPCSLRPDLSNRPLTPPEPYPDPQPADASDSQQQPTDASDPQHETADASNPEQQGILASQSFESWGDRCSSFFKWMYTFAFQLPLHIFLLIWHLSTACMGVMNLKGCYMNQFLPPVMIFVGVSGTAAVLWRLRLMVRERFGTVSGSPASWLVVLGADSTTWVFSASELYYFFEQAPSFTPGDKHYCIPSFYTTNTVVIYLSVAWMTGWLMVNSVKFFYWVSRKYEIINQLF